MEEGDKNYTTSECPAKGSFVGARSDVNIAL